MKFSKAISGAVALAVAIPAAASAQDVTAADPQGMTELLDMAGYEAELGKDNAGDPMITAEFGGRSARVFFYGCDEETKADCDAVQLSVGFDREDAWTAQEAIQLPKDFRFAAVSLDDEGDPYVTWDIVTGEGIPAKVFLRSIVLYSDMISEADRIIFAAERGQE